MSKKCLSVVEMWRWCRVVVSFEYGMEDREKRRSGLRKQATCTTHACVEILKNV